MYVEKANGKITLEQLELMCHSIGFCRKRIRYNKYEVYRNYFDAGQGDEPILDELVKVGLMEKVTDSIYCVTKDGFKFLGNIFECKIIEEN